MKILPILLISMLHTVSVAVPPKKRSSKPVHDLTTEIDLKHKSDEWKALLLKEERDIRNTISQTITGITPQLRQQIAEITKGNNSYQDQYNNMINGSTFIRQRAINTANSSDPKIQLFLAEVLLIEPEATIRASAVQALSKAKNISNPFVYVILTDSFLNDKQRVKEMSVEPLLKNQSSIETIEAFIAILMSFYIRDIKEYDYFRSHLTQALTQVIEAGLTPERKKQGTYWNKELLDWVKERLQILAEWETPAFKSNINRLIQIITSATCSKSFGTI